MSDSDSDDAPEEVVSSKQRRPSAGDDDDGPEEASSSAQPGGGGEDAPRKKRARTTGTQRRLAAATRARAAEAAPEPAEDFIALPAEEPPRPAPERRRRVARNVFVSDESTPLSLFDSKPSQSALDLEKRKMGAKKRVARR